MAKRQLRKTNRTILIIVEGDTEFAFVSHVKSLYCDRAKRLTIQIKNAHGHGPQGVISKLFAVMQTAEHDHRVVVLDTDIPLKPAETQKLKSAKVETIFSSPAFEATLLGILGKRIPDLTAACKQNLQKYAAGDQTDIRFYQKYFPLEKLEKAREKVKTLDALIKVVSTE